MCHVLLLNVIQLLLEKQPSQVFFLFKTAALLLFLFTIDKSILICFQI